jgi:hypothetical protein
MTVRDATAQPRGSAEFAESSVLEAVVPLSSSVNLSEELAAWDGGVDSDHHSVLPFLSQRHFLLFGEQDKAIQ